MSPADVLPPQTCDEEKHVPRVIAVSLGQQRTAQSPVFTQRLRPYRSRNYRKVAMSTSPGATAVRSTFATKKRPVICRCGLTLSPTESADCECKAKFFCWEASQFSLDPAHPPPGLVCDQQVSSSLGGAADDWNASQTISRSMAYPTQSAWSKLGMQETILRDALTLDRTAANSSATEFYLKLRNDALVEQRVLECTGLAFQGEVSRRPYFSLR